MKQLKIIISILFMGLIFCCCDNRTDEQKYLDYKAKLEKAREDSTNKVRYHGFNVVVIDSCEYLIKIDAVTHHSYGLMSHKGNCKFCKENGRD